jgi:hypothetical protein
MMILAEEEHLSNIFGEKYIQNFVRVPRYLSIGKKLNSLLSLTFPEPRFMLAYGGKKGCRHET